MNHVTPREAAYRFGFLPREGFESWPAEQICSGLSRIGYRAVEWSRAHFRVRELPPAALRRLVTVPADFGMVVSEIAIALDYVVLDEAVRRDHIALTQECIAAAGELGVPALSVSTGPHPWAAGSVRIPQDISEGAAWEMVFDAFDQILPAAERAGVDVLVEGAWGNLAHDYYTTLPIFARYDSPRLGINMDPSHGALCRNDIPWVIHQWGKRIRHVHLKDAIGRPGVDGEDFIFPLLGEGLIDWRAFFAALREIGYAGVCSVEFESWAYARQVLHGDMLAAARLAWDILQRLTADG
jgi:sugar phosphate isomerase/epimerase